MDIVPRKRHPYVRQVRRKGERPTISQPSNVAILCLAVVVLGSPPAWAMGTGVTCELTTYYSTAQKTHQVGLFSSCPGSKPTGSGTKTKFFTTTKINTALGGDGKNGLLKCEIIDDRFTCTAHPIMHPQ